MSLPGEHSVNLSKVITASLTILDVGHGNCSIVANEDTTIIIDAGPGNAVLEYLRQEGITCVDSIILSHADADHIRGVNALLGTTQFEVKEIIANSDAAKDTQAWANLVWDIDVRQRKGDLRSEAQLREGDILTTQVNGVELTVLAPRTGLALTGPGSKDLTGRRITSNTMSAVILVKSAGRRVALLTGDLDEIGLDHLINTGQDLTAAVLVFPHHGGLARGSVQAAEEFAIKLTTAVQPSDVVFSLDRGRYGTPRPEVIAGVRKAAPKARIACTQLSEACAAELPSEASPHLLPLFAKGREANACCAGTMRMALGGPVDVLEPTGSLHRVFVDKVAVTALCTKV